MESNEKSEFPCRSCNQVFSVKASLFMHSMSCFQPTTIEYNNTVFQFTYQPEITCNDCQQNYATVEVYNSHLAVCLQNLQQKTLELTSLANNVTVEERVNESEPKTFYLQNLQQKPLEPNSHVTVKEEVDESEPKTLECQFCKKKFSRKWNLDKHVQGHIGGRSFECEICGKKFVWKNNLKTHRDSVHGKDGKEHKCSFCGQTFTLPASVRRHIQHIHQGIRFKCELCGSSFTQKPKLNLHMRKNHGMVKKEN